MANLFRQDQDVAYKSIQVRSRFRLLRFWTSPLYSSGVVETEALRLTLGRAGEEVEEESGGGREGSDGKQKSTVEYLDV